MNIRHTPASVAAPFGPYSHAVEVPEGSRLLYISGEVGVQRRVVTNLPGEPFAIAHRLSFRLRSLPCAG
jgi:enamine deaminase RidA (YjgF/YER057c/UK114 family)